MISRQTDMATDSSNTNNDNEVKDDNEQINRHAYRRGEGWVCRRTDRRRQREKDKIVRDKYRKTDRQTKIERHRQRLKDKTKDRKT